MADWHPSSFLRRSSKAFELAPEASVPQQDVGVRGGILGIQGGGGKEDASSRDLPRRESCSLAPSQQVGGGGLLQGTGSEPPEGHKPHSTLCPFPPRGTWGGEAARSGQARGLPAYGEGGRLPGGWRRDPSPLFPRAQPGQPRGARRVLALKPRARPLAPLPSLPCQASSPEASEQPTEKSRRRIRSDPSTSGLLRWQSGRPPPPIPPGASSEDATLPRAGRQLRPEPPGTSAQRSGERRPSTG